MKKLFSLLFFAIILAGGSKAATFSSVSSGTWSAPATWSVIGIDADGIPDSDDDVTVNVGHTIDFTTMISYMKSLTNFGTIRGNSNRLYTYGNINNNGAINQVIMYVLGPCTFSSSTLFNGAISWWVYSSLTISPSTTITCANPMIINQTGANVTNNGTVTIASIYFNSIGIWTNAANSSLFLSSNISGTGTLSFSAPGNTITYYGNSCNQIRGGNYYNLTIQAAPSATRTIINSDVVVQNDFVLKNSSTYPNLMNLNNFNLNIAGNWNNLCNTSNILNAGTITLNGTSNQTISSVQLSEIFDNLTIAPSSSVTLNKNITVNKNLNLNSNSMLDVSASNYSITLKGNLVNNGNINTRQNIFTFNGTTTQTIGGTGTSPFYNILISNASGVTLGQNLSAAKNFSVNASSIFDVSTSNYSVSIAGDLVNNGTINAQQGSFTFNGSVAQTISGISSNTFYNLTLNNSLGLTVNSLLSLKNILTVANGNFNSNGNVTLISDATKTGAIGPVGSGGSFSGNMTIQKYISARASHYHDLSSPVQNTTIMDWDDELYMSGIGPDDGIPGRPGVDGSAGGTYSVFRWNETTGNTAPDYGWSAVIGSNTPLINGSAYEIYIADDPTNFTGGTIDTRGVPQFGNKTVNLSYTSSQGAYAGSNLVGNPFASAVDLALCSKTNVTGNVLILDNSGNYTDYGANPVIPAHQGFWITAASSGASITFNETAKSNNTTTTFYRTPPSYGIKLVFSSPSSPYFNENTINFNTNSSLGFDKATDALYLKSPNPISPAMYMLSGTDEHLITNSINSDKDEVNIPLAFFTPKDATYYIYPTILNTDLYKYAWIENTKTGKQYDLNSSIPVLGEEKKTNYDFVLRLSKNHKESYTSATIFDNDIIVFSSENDINLKSLNTKHYISEVAVYDLAGKLILKTRNLTVDMGESTKIDISSLTKGVYIVHVIDFSGHQKTQKVIH